MSVQYCSYVWSKVLILFIRRGKCSSVVLPQIRAFEPKGKLAVVNPQRRIGCAPLMPQYWFTRDQCGTVQIWDVGPGLAPAKPSPHGGRRPYRQTGTPSPLPVGGNLRHLSRCTVTNNASQAADLKGGGLRYLALLRHKKRLDLQKGYCFLKMGTQKSTGSTNF